MWTEDQARALITDSGTLKRGMELAAPVKWGNLGRTAAAVWGECAGSGAKPYLVGIDLSEPAFKCSCPSRVFPCKHGAGLLLLLARQPQILNAATPPTWLAEWLEKRQSTQEKKAAKPTEAPPPTAPLAGAPQEEKGPGVSAQRLERMRRGADELLTWLHDLVGAGLAQTEKQPAAFWENQAARLIDDQLPGLAATLRELASLRHYGPDWPERMLARLGELYLLVRAFQRFDKLPAPRQQDVLQLLGVNVKKDEVLRLEPTVVDTWLVMGQLTFEEERLLVRRTWLRGHETGHYALVLEYAFGGQAFASPLVPNGRYHGGLAFYPGTASLRAVIGPDWSFEGTAAPGQLLFSGNPEEVLSTYADALAQQPWLREWPVLLAAVVPVLLPGGNVVLLASDSASSIPVSADEDLRWQLLAVSGGHPLTIFGEWNGVRLLPLSFHPATVAP
ncbi:hypothetical protein [Hymenobacter koreensis]|uniref:SWIM zinc finger family protein n=1 Tax=Hymenobacter koreensis TaxID=1084523 RepID=A0ABP8J6U1_9BACT